LANPKEEARKPGLGYCGDSVYGDHWLGPTSLSLVNLAGPMLLNTVEITGPAFMSDPAESFRLPFFVANYYYTVPKIGSNREGVPRILNLRDLTGDGIAAEFVLFMYGACGIVPTGVFGYSQQADRAVWYAIEVSDGKQKAAVQFWVDQVFARKPVRPGYWDFKWDPGHGADVTIRDQVSFDAARQLFVIKQTTTPYSETVHPK